MSVIKLPEAGSQNNFFQLIKDIKKELEEFFEDKLRVNINTSMINMGREFEDLMSAFSYDINNTSEMPYNGFFVDSFELISSDDKIKIALFMIYYDPAQEFPVLFRDLTDTPGLYQKVLNNDVMTEVVKDFFSRPSTQLLLLNMKRRIL
jgi:hypothetical protein